MDTSFLGAAYASRSPLIDSDTCVNLYPELNKEGKVGGFQGTPGLGAVFVSGGGEVRGLWKVGGPLSGFGELLFAVIGNTVYRIDENYVGLSIGTLPNASGPVSICDNGRQVAFAHPDGIHACQFFDPAIAPVLNAPLGAVLTGMDNYLIFTQGRGGQFGVSAIGDLTSIDPLDVATAEGWPDDCIACIADHRETWLFGTETTEVWGDTGGQFFPFGRVAGGFIEQGCIAPFSVVKLDNSVFWLGADRKGRGVWFRSNIYTPERISTHAMEFAINSDSITDAISYAYQDEGHSFVVITFPSLDQTWVYDVATKLIHRRGAMDRNGLLRRHTSNCYAFFSGDILVGDSLNGKIYRMSLDYATDDGNPIYRERAWSLEGDIENKKFRIDQLELHCLTGEPELITQNIIKSDSPWDDAWDDVWGEAWGKAATTVSESKRLNQVWLEISGDSGRTWGYKRFQTLGPLGQRFQRLRWRRGGAKRNINLRLGTDMQVPVSWVGAYMDGELLSK